MKRYLALCGGVGGAKLARGLAMSLPSESLTIAVNTGDDFQHMGLHISPDIDTVIYHLANVYNREQGWGLQNESWSFMQQVTSLGMEDWFRLGDKDLATHVFRSDKLRKGDTLSSVTQQLARRFGISLDLVPMSDDPVPTKLKSENQWLDFQTYFVKRQCRDTISEIHYQNAQNVAPSEGLKQALADPNLAGVIFCPSNPLLSIAPILAVRGVKEAISNLSVPRILVSPLVGDKAFKGPTVEILRSMGITTNIRGLCDYYDCLITDVILDHQDEAQLPFLSQRLQCHQTNIKLSNDQDKQNLAQFCRRVIDEGATQ
ncbi:MAG: 2-phospho-L-lactate transferase [Aestuariibacter sp.]